MSFNKGKIKDIYLLTTDVENMFINEYMPGAPGDYVKVYLYGLLYAQNESEMTHETMARQLGLTEENVCMAWDYWASMGVVKKIYKSGPGPFNFDIEYVYLREKMYGNFSKDEKTADASLQAALKKQENLVESELKEILEYMESLLGRVLSPKDSREIFSWVKELGASTELIKEAAEYCCERGKTNVNYIAKVVLEWNKKGLRDAEEIREYIQNLGERQSLYKKVLNSLGLIRAATPAEKRTIDKWADEMGFSEKRILEACDTTFSTANPNLRYVNKVLENWKTEADIQGRDVNKKNTVTQAVLNKYYEYLRNEAEKEAEERRREVYEAVPQIKEIDEKLLECSSKISRGMLTGMKREDIEKLKSETTFLEEERAVLLTDNNFMVDYTDIRYSCEKCSDTGIDENGGRCSCSKNRIGEAEIWQKENN